MSIHLGRGVFSHCTRTFFERFYERPVGFENILVGKPCRLHPFESLSIETLRLTRKALHDPHGELNVPISVGVSEAHQGMARQDFDPEFFTELARERVRLRLSYVHFATRKFPAARHMLAGGSLGEEDASVAIVERRRDDKESRLQAADTLTPRSSVCRDSA
jgi:hypothetical protein